MTQTASLSLRTLGNSDLQLTPIGFGAWAIGGGDWAIRLGPSGRQRLHRRHPPRRSTWASTGSTPRPSTASATRKKSSGAPSNPHRTSLTSSPSAPCAGTPTAPSTTRSRPRRSPKNSKLRCERLGVDTIDLYQIHWPNPEDEIEEGWEALARLREQGKVRWIGVSNFSVEQMKRAQKIAPITSLQPPYSMLRRAIEAEILPFAQANGIGVINYSPMVSGLLTGKMTAERVAALPADDWRRKNMEFNEPRLSRNLRLVDLLREIGSGHGVTPGVVAVAWTLHNPAITAAIVGGRSATAGGRDRRRAHLPAQRRGIRPDRRVSGHRCSREAWSRSRA